MICALRGRSWINQYGVRAGEVERRPDASATTRPEHVSARTPAPARGGGKPQAIDWKRFASALILFAVSMSRSVIFMPASWVQNEKETML